MADSHPFSHAVFCLGRLVINSSGAGFHSAVKVKHGKSAASGIKITSAYWPESTDPRLHNSPQTPSSSQIRTSNARCLPVGPGSYRQAAQSRISAVNVSAACPSLGPGLRRQGAAPTVVSWAMAILRHGHALGKAFTTFRRCICKCRPTVAVKVSNNEHLICDGCIRRAFSDCAIQVHLLATFGWTVSASCFSEH